MTARKKKLKELVQSKHAKAVDKGIRAQTKHKAGIPINRSDKDRRKRV